MSVMGIADALEVGEEKRARRAPVVGLGTVSGRARWYDDGSGIYGAAGPLLRHGDWRGSRVTVRAGGKSLAVALTDWCACGDRHGIPTLIDLSPEAFQHFAPLSQGVVRVQIETGGQPRLVPPSTDCVCVP